MKAEMGDSRSQGVPVTDGKPPGQDNRCKDEVSEGHVSPGTLGLQGAGAQGAGRAHSFQKEPAPLTPWPWTSGLQSWESNFLLFKLPPCPLWYLLQQPRQMNTERGNKCRE